jgi:hypothetical protein
VSARLIESDALDRDGVARSLNELAANNPQLMDHVTSGGGGLVDGLQMRSLRAAGVLSGESGRLASRGGLRAAGIHPFLPDSASAFRDMAGGVVEATAAGQPVDTAEGSAPRSIEELTVSLGAAYAGQSCARSSPPSPATPAPR